jgi:hypothetical protein
MWRSTARGLGLASLLLAGLPAVPAAAASDEELAEIKKLLEESKDTIRSLEARIEQLEGEAAPATPPVSTAPEEEEAAAQTAQTDQSGQPPSPVEDAEREMRARQYPVHYRANLDDRQGPAARPGDYTLDPEFRGFIPIPNTVVMIKFNAKPRVDFIYDSGDPGTSFRFVPALFPPSNQEGWQFGANANGSQLRVDVQAPSVEGTPRFYYQNDFFGSNDSHMRYRLQHLYGEYAGFLAGFTYGVFEDPDAWPDTVDYEGTNSVIFARRAVAQYLREICDDWELMVSLENPDTFVDTTGSDGADPRFRAPDGVFALKWTPGELGYFRASTIFRSIGVDNGTLGDDDVFGWGINTSANIRLTSRDNLQYYFNYGHGIGGMGNDTSFVNSDAAFDGSGNLQALEYWSTMIALTHQWTPRWRSTATHGYVHLENVAMQDPTFYHASHYASLNLVYQLFKRVRIGVEGLYGWKEVNDGSTNDIFRLQAGLAFALFD